MALFSFFNKKEFFSPEEKQRIIDAIRESEQRTSGEIRIYIESRCRFVDPLDRAAEVFWGLKMEQTNYHNAVLVYVAVRDHQYAIYADKGIHEKLGDQFWKEEVQAMQQHFIKNHVAEAIEQVAEEDHLLRQPGSQRGEDEQTDHPP